MNEHPINTKEEYIRDLYFKMLCVVAQYECDDTENEFTLIRRIMAACTETQPLAEYIKRSMEITPDRTAEFIKQCKDNGLCEIFMIDAILLSCSNGSPNIKQAAFIAQFGDMLGFDKNEISEIAKFAHAILEQDSENYQKALNQNNDAIQTSALCYAKEFVIGLIICTSKRMWYYAKKPANFTIPEDEDIQLDILDEVKFENLIINDIGRISLKMIKNVVLENCHCMRGPLSLVSIDKVLINNCDFRWSGAKNIREGDHSINRAIWTNLNNYVLTVTNTNFSGYEVCRYDTSSYYRRDYYYSGAVFYNDNEDYGTNIISFDRCNFSDIYTAQSQSDCYGRYAIYYSKDSAKVTNCHFSNCRSDRSSNALFSGVNKKSGNTLINSNPIS